MSQMVATPPLAGLLLGWGVKIFSGRGDPNDVSTDSSAGNLAGCALGSLFLRVDVAGLYQKTAAASPSAVTGTWTAK